MSVMNYGSLITISASSHWCQYITISYSQLLAYYNNNMQIFHIFLEQFITFRNGGQHVDKVNNSDAC